MKHKQEAKESPVVIFQKGDLVGSGPFGSVYQGLSATGKIIAIKCLHSEKGDNFKKIESLRALSHPNVVKYIDTVYYKEMMDVLMEYAPAGSMKAVVQNFGALNEKVTRLYTKQILTGLTFLHSKGIIHNDLKASNVLVDNEAIVKLTDFGFSDDLIKKLKTESEKPMWLPPEYFSEKCEVTETFDVWSLGILILEVICVKEFKWDSVPSDPDTVEKQVRVIIPRSLSTICKLFVQSCLMFNPRQRATLAELLAHPFLTISNDPEKKYALEQIKRQIMSLSISGSQQIKKFNKVSVPDIVYSINSIYLSGVNVLPAESVGRAKAEEQNVRFTTSMESSGAMERGGQPREKAKREEMSELEVQLMKEKEAMKKLIEGYPNIE
eukprot:TRINITY_DN3385_c0_g1_i17.p1 TRINITY_DN3385_c0_g1~~TRINITY_DN3385_c0_g1_i17.p1  ORF type:complete len:381 (-),score=125.95 TRINITY_DN3385_c0_g1_i17:132-1274(-)